MRCAADGHDNHELHIVVDNHCHMISNLHIGYTSFYKLEDDEHTRLICFYNVDLSFTHEEFIGCTL